MQSIDRSEPATEAESASDSDSESEMEVDDQAASGNAAVDMDKSLPARPSHETTREVSTFHDVDWRKGRVERLLDGDDHGAWHSSGSMSHRRPTVIGDGSLPSASCQRRKVSRPSLGPQTFMAPVSQPPPQTMERQGIAAGDDDAWEVLTDGRASLDSARREAVPREAMRPNATNDPSRDFTVQVDTDGDIGETMRVRTWKSAENGGRPSSTLSLSRAEGGSRGSSSLGPRRSLHLKNLASTLSLRRSHGQGRRAAAQRLAERHSGESGAMPEERSAVEAPACFPQRHASTAASSYSGPSTIRPVKPLASSSASSISITQRSPVKGSPDYRQLRPIVPFAREALISSRAGEDSVDFRMDDSEQTITMHTTVAQYDPSTAETTTDGHFSITSGAEQRYAEVSNVYPSLEPSDSIPGAFPATAMLAKDSDPFIFGSPVQKGVSADQFARAGQVVLDEMNARLAGKGVQKIGRLPSGVGGLNGQASAQIGRVGGTSATGSRFDAAHAKAFSK